MMYNYDGFYFSHMFGFSSLFMIIFWGFIIYGLVMIFRNNGHCSHNKNQPLDILKERYAKGEITKEQFESIKKDI